MPAWTRSLEPIRHEDLRMLAILAREDRERFFARNPGTAALYADRLLSKNKKRLRSEVPVRQVHPPQTPG